MTAYRIVDRYNHLNETDAGRKALDEYEGALARGMSQDEAEVLASNVLQRSGYNVNKSGGVSIAAVYRVEIDVGSTEAEQFRDWLNLQGHDAKVGTSTGSYVDGVQTTEPGASETLNSLWSAYCNS